MAQQAKKYVYIVSGPSKDELMVGLIDNTDSHPRSVNLTLQYPGGPAASLIALSIESVGIEDGSGESWLLRGNDKTNRRRYRLYYSSKSRTGTVMESVPYGQPFAPSTNGLVDIAGRTDVVEGPSKHDLMMALFARTASRPYPVRIKLKSGVWVKECEVRVEEIGLNGGSGRDWVVQAHDWKDRVVYRFSYSTHDRSGIVQKMR